MLNDVVIRQLTGRRLMSDLRALFIGIVGSSIAYYAIKGIEYYLTRRPIRSRQRQIQQLRQEIEVLAKLGVSDRSLLLFAFQFLFVVIALAALGVAGSILFSFVRPLESFPMVLMVSSIIGIVAFYAATVFKKLEDPQPTLAKLRQKLHDIEEANEEGGA